MNAESNERTRRASTRGYATMSERDREQRRRCPELTVLQLRIVKLVLSILATLLAIWQGL